MRRVLLVIILVECIALAGGGAVHFFGGLDRFARRTPVAPTFVPPVYTAVIGDTVRYRRESRDGTTLGYLQYRVDTAFEYEGTNFGREYFLHIEQTDAHGKQRRTRTIRYRPRAIGHGFLPIRFEEEDSYPQGARPVIRTLQPDRVPLRKGSVDGFRLDCVIPRESLTEIRERFWITKEVPIFGVARWERGDEVLVVHTMKRGGS